VLGFCFLCLDINSAKIIDDGSIKLMISRKRFKLLIPPPADDPNGEGDSSELIRHKALEKGVLALPGTAFLPNGRRSAYVRCSISMLDDEKTDEALRRLGEAVREARAA
jgi:tryptophan aminotransferase